MPMLYTLGRVLFVLIFIFSGVTKLLDIPGTAAMVAARFRSNSARSSATPRCSRLATWRSL